MLLDSLKCLPGTVGYGLMWPLRDETHEPVIMWPKEETRASVWERHHLFSKTLS